MKRTFFLRTFLGVLLLLGQSYGKEERFQCRPRLRPNIIHLLYNFACRAVLGETTALVPYDINTALMSMEITTALIPYNTTKCNPEVEGLPYSIPETVVIASLAGTLSVVTVLGNSMVMISFKIDRQLQTISNYFLFSLAVADFAIGLISMPLFTISTLLGYWPLGRHICDTWLALDYLASNASVLNLLIISFDRYFSVTRPLTYRAKRTTTKAAIMIAGAWGISLLLWPPWIYAWPYIEGKRTVPERECYIQFIETNHYITFGTAIAAFYIPVSVMIVLYYRIWRETKKRQKDLPHLQAGYKSSGRRVATSRYGTETTLDNLRRMNGFHMEEPAPERRRTPWCGWLRRWCIKWWYSGRGSETDIEETGSEMGTMTPVSFDTPRQEVSRTTSFIVTPGTREPTPSTSREPIVHHPDIHWSEPSTSKTPPTTTPTARTPTTGASTTPTTPSARTPTGPSTTPTVRITGASTTPNTPTTRTPIASTSRTPPGPSTAPTTPSARTPIPGRSSSPTPPDSLFDEGPPIVPSLSPRATGEQVYASIPDDGIYTIMIRLPEKPMPEEATIEEVKAQSSIKLFHNEITPAKRTPPGMRKRRNVPSRDVGTSTVEDLNSILPCPPPPAARRPSILPERIPYKLPRAIRSRAKRKKKTSEKKQDKKAARTLTAILLSFIITWTPYNVLVLLKPVTTGYACIPQQLWDFFYYLCYINSTINPVCYALCNASFRRTYVRILTCRWKSRERVGVQRGGFNQN